MRSRLFVRNEAAPENFESNLRGFSYNQDAIELVRVGVDSCMTLPHNSLELTGT